MGRAEAEEGGRGGVEGVEGEVGDCWDVAKGGGCGGEEVLDLWRFGVGVGGGGWWVVGEEMGI